MHQKGAAEWDNGSKYQCRSASNIPAIDLFVDGELQIDAKQFWGLEDFMNVNPTAVTNAANLSLFMVNLSQVLMCDFRQMNPDFGILDLKSYYRGCKYATEMLKILPQKPDDILVAQLFQKIATLGSIHLANSSVHSP